MCLPIDLPNLKVLDIRFVSFENADAPNMLISGSPSLKSLTLVDFEFDLADDFVLIAPTLDSLVIRSAFSDYLSDLEDCKIHLYAPNLKSFRCYDSAARIVHLSSSDCPNVDKQTSKALNLVQRVTRLLEAVVSIESLTLSVWLLTVAFDPPWVPESLLSLQFYNLKYLKLKTWLCRDCTFAILHLLKISPYVETLAIEILTDDGQKHICRKERILTSENMGMLCPLHSSKPCIYPRLRYLAVRGAIGLKNELEVELIGNVLRSAISLKLLDIWPDKENAYDVADRKDQIVLFATKLRSIPPASSKLSIAFL